MFNDKKIEELLKKAKLEVFFPLPKDFLQGKSVLGDKDERYERLKKWEVVELDEEMYCWLTWDSCGPPCDDGDAASIGVHHWSINTEVPNLFEGGYLCWQDNDCRMFGWMLDSDELFYLSDEMDENGEWI